MTSTEQLQDGVQYDLATIVRLISSMRASGLVGPGCRRLVEFNRQGHSTAPVMCLIRFDRDSKWPLTPQTDQHEVGSIRLRSDVLHDGAFADARVFYEYLDRDFGSLRLDATRYTAGRTGGRRQFGQVPCWYFQTGSYLNSMPGSQPSGPFLIPEENRLFGNLPSLGAWWLGDSSMDGHLRRGHGLVVPDYRGYFTRATIASNGLKVQIHRETDDDLFVAAQGRDVFDRDVVIHRPIRGRTVLLPETRWIRNMRLLLLDRRSDYPLDEEWIGDMPDVIGEVVIGAKRLQPHRSQRLAELLMHGEGPTVEYKKWSVIDELKLGELAETITAFLNHKGGSVLIGVDDHGEVVGSDVLVRSTVKGPDDDDGRAKLASICQEFLLDAIVPRCSPRVLWHELGGLRVLEVSVTTQPVPGFSLQRTKEAFVRRGATNERMTVWDAAAALTAKRSR